MIVTTSGVPTEGVLNVAVEVAFNAGYMTAAADRVWTDVSEWVELSQEINIGRGRADEFSTCEPNTLSLALDNTDGRFTAGRAASPYYPNVKIGRPVRVTTTQHDGTNSVRFVGYVDEWPIEWDGTDAHSWARITASSRMARLGNSPRWPTLAYLGSVRNEPSAYWPLTEAKGATQGLDASGNNAPPMRPWLGDDTANKKLPTFGTGTGPATDGLPAVSLPSGGKSLRAIGLDTTPLAAISMMVYVRATGDVGAQMFPILWRDAINEQYVAVLFAPTAVVAVKTASGSINNFADVNIFDGEAHVIAVTMTAGATPTIKLYLDGDQVGSWALASAPNRALTDVQTGLYTAGGGTASASVGHVGLWKGVALSADEIEVMSKGMLEGFLDDDPGTRIERLAVYAGVDLDEVSAEDGYSNMAHIDTEGQTSLDVMRVVETTEGGVLFDARDNTLTFHGRSHRYLATSAFTLDMVAQQIESDFAPKYDRFAMQNDVTVALSSGIATVRAYDQSSIDDYGPMGQEVELATTDENEPHAAAWWRVNTYAEPRPRTPSVSVDLLPLAPALQASVLGADVGSRFTITGVPAQAATTVGDHFVEGYAENIGPASYVFTFNTSDATAYVSTFVLQDATRGHLDGSTRLAY